jgi:hypothetical protein
VSAGLLSPDATAVDSRGFIDFRNAALCGLAVVIAVLLTNPFAESPFNDDWSYSITVRQLVQPGTLKLAHWAQQSASQRYYFEHLPTRGKLIYNGWASASLIAQAYWGLLWVKLFGFSYVVLRLSTLPLAALAASICYLLGRMVGLNRQFALFSTLLMGLSPLYLPVASSFMTDAPGLFFILLSMYCLGRAMNAKTTGPAIAWLLIGSTIGMIGGTGRQFVWVVPLVMLPYTAWLRRANTTIVVCAILSWIAVLGGALYTVHWFNAQPYSIPEIPLRDELRLAIKKPPHYLLRVLAIPLTAIWVMFPALWGILLRGWKANRALIVVLAMLGPVLLLVKFRPKYGVAPWMPNTLSAQGVMGGAELAGDRPIIISMPMGVIIAIIVFTVASILMADLLIWLSRLFTAFRTVIRAVLFPENGHGLLPAMVLFALAYFTLLLPRCASNMAYDRYIIPLMPCVLFPLLLRYQREGDRKVPIASWLLLGFYALWAIGITQEVTALGRARAQAADIVIASGKRRPLIDAGFEFCNETQVLETGYVNDPRIKIPRGAFKPHEGPTYIVQSKYRLEFESASDTKPSEFGYVDYTTYLYPFHRRIYIDQYIDPWWLDPRKAATRPADKWHSVINLPDSSSDDSK